MYPGQVKIIAERNAPRLNYTAGLILGDILGLDWEIITDLNDRGDYPLINYSSILVPGSFKIQPFPLLFEYGIRPVEISVSDWNGLPVIFHSTSDSDIPFDIFASSFYLVSRYEEYLEYQPDKHGRFAASSSIAYRNGFLTIPVVDLWAKAFADLLSAKYPWLVFRKREYKALLTIDSDQPFAYKGKGLLRTMGGLVHDIAVWPRNSFERLRVLSGKSSDPFAVYDYIISNIEETSSDAKFFFPAGKLSDYDRNPSWKNQEYRNLIRETGEKYVAGLHPSYYASENSQVFRTEKDRLQSVLGREINISRFHFIRFKLPGSYKMLIDEGISEDHSMGYPDEPGFRAGIAGPFMFYDLEEEKTSGLKVVPFQVMDATLYQYRQLDPDLAEELILKLISETRKAGGLFVSLWHNTSLQDKPEWQGWRRLFEKMLKIQQT